MYLNQVTSEQILILTYNSFKKKRKKPIHKCCLFQAERGKVSDSRQEIFTGTNALSRVSQLEPIQAMDHENSFLPLNKKALLYTRY